MKNLSGLAILPFGRSILPVGVIAGTLTVTRARFSASERWPSNTCALFVAMPGWWRRRSGACRLSCQARRRDLGPHQVVGIRAAQPGDDGAKGDEGHTAKRNAIHRHRSELNKNPRAAAVMLRQGGPCGNCRRSQPVALMRLDRHRLVARQPERRQESRDIGERQHFRLQPDAERVRS